MRRLFANICLFCCFVLFGATAFAEQYSAESSSLVAAARYVKAILSHKGVSPEQVLVVFDIDNTLLTTPKHCPSPQALQCQYLGGVAWYNWQHNLLIKHPDSPDLVGDNVDKLNAVQAFLNVVTPMELTEPGAPGIIHSLKKMGVHVMMETARSSEMMSVTEQQLKLHGIRHFSRHWEHPRHRSRRLKSCVAPKKRAATQFHNGVFYINGGDKARALQCFLQSAQHERDIKAIVFVDDSAHNLQLIQQRFAGHYEVATVHYTKMQQKVAAFLRGAKRHQYQAQCTLRWQHILHALAGAIPQLMFDASGSH